MKNIQDFLKKNGIIRVSPEDTLSESLSKLSSSHDAAFVMDEDEFIGVINPYHGLIQNPSYDGKTKTSKAVYHPPKIKSSDTLERISQMMVSSKVHYLPVFNENDEFVGITSARRLLKLMQDSVSHTRLSQISAGKKRSVVTISENETIEKALQIFKEIKVSKLVAVDKHGKLSGVLSYYDMIPFLIAPPEKKTYFQRVGEKENNFKNLLVKNYMKKTLITMDSASLASQGIQMILEKKIGSVILTDSTQKPLDIITTRDFLELLKSDGDVKEVKLSIKSFNPAHRLVLDEFADYVEEHIKNDDRYMRAEIVVDEEKARKEYKITVHLFPKKGKTVIFEKESHDLPSLLKDLKNLVRRDR